MNTSLALVPQRSGVARPDVPAISLVDLLDAYIDHRNGERAIGDELSPKTHQHYSECIKAFANWLGRPASTADLTVDNVNAFLVAMHAAKRSPHGIKSVRTGLTVLMRFARLVGLSNEDAAFVRRIRCPRIDVQGYTREQMQQLVEECNRLHWIKQRSGLDRRLYYLSMFLVLWETGLRIGDIPAIRVEKFDPRGCLWALEHKTGKSRWRPLTPDATESIAALIALDPGREFIWPGHKAASLMKTAKKIMRAAGLPGTSKFIRRGSASELDRLHPGQGWRFLSHSTPMVFENHYRVPAICDIDGIAPPALQLSDASKRIYRPAVGPVAKEKAPPTPKSTKPEPTSADVTLSPGAREALQHVPLTASDLAVLAECLKSQGVTQTRLAEWWGYKLKFYQNMRYGRKAVPHKAANRLREMFGLSAMLLPTVTPKIDEHSVPASQVILAILNREKWIAADVRTVLDYVCNELGLTQTYVAQAIGTTCEALSDMKSGGRRATDEMVARLRGLFTNEAYAD
jgi:integrase/plasmid maintenance system antidote protein VapI